jgi:hypothetical protein
LERASRKVASTNFEIVRSSNDLAHAHAPRIVKLHGTVGLSDQFVFAEEDYRTYPQKSAAFVNFARQVFIENELCLIGFSGDDPNFLQWSGWVRDHLSNSARRIYLVGVLQLSPAKRKLLESRNIAPIDLAPLVESIPKENRHRTAMDMLLSYLETSKPIPAHQWMPKQRGVTSDTGQITDADVATRAIIEQSHQWKIDREHYPGWLVCPHDVRVALRWECSSGISLLRTAGNALKDQAREQVLFELTWRFETAMMQLSPFLVTALTALANDIEKTALTREQRRLLVGALLRTAREQEDEASFSHWSIAMERLSESDAEALVEMRYQQSLRMKDRMDLSGLEKSLISIEGSDPVWKLRRAFLLCELRKWSDAQKLCLEALDELRERESDARDSLWIRSRRAWAQWLAALSTFLRSSSKDDDLISKDFSREEGSKCNPWTEIESLARSVSEAHRKQLTEEAEAFVPLFEPGSYRDNSRTLHFVSERVVSPAYTMQRLMESVGVPVNYEHVNVLHFAPDAIWLQHDVNAKLYLKLVHYADREKDRLVVQYLGRTTIATLPMSIVNTLVNVIFDAIEYWKRRCDEEVQFGERLSPLGALINLISLLYRLTPRMEDGTAARCFRLGLEMGGDRKLSHHWFSEPVANLLQHSARAMSAETKSKEILAATEFPLASELHQNFPNEDRWPNPLDCLLEEPISFSRTGQEARWSERIAQLLKMAVVNLHRSQAVLRLSTLAMAKGLEVEELSAFGDAIWAQTDEASNNLPTGTRLLPHMFAVLPAPQNIDSANRVRKWLFDDVDSIVSNVVRLDNIFYAAAYIPQRIFPASAQAEVFFDRLVELGMKSEKSESIPHNPFEFHQDGPAKSAARALAVSIVKSLDPSARTKERANLLLTLTHSEESWNAIGALPYFATSSNEFSNLAEERIGEGMMGLTFEEVAASTWAIEAWQQLYDSGEHSAVPPRLIEAAVGALEARRDVGLPQVVKCCRKLLKSHANGSVFLRRIARATVAISKESDYAKISPTDRRAISVSMVRAECASLIQELLPHMEEPVLRAWLNEAKVDPLPEVRFAAMNS